EAGPRAAVAPRHRVVRRSSRGCEVCRGAGAFPVIRRIAVAALTIAGLFLVARGTQWWLDVRAVRSVVGEYLGALRDGDRERALNCLTPERRTEIEAGERTGGPVADLSLPDPGWTWRVHH